MAGQVVTASGILPADAQDAVLVGRVWSKAEDGPCPVLIRDGQVFNLTGIAATVSSLFEMPEIAARLKQASGLPDLGPLDAFLDSSAGQLLAPIDLQSVKAAGVTFADSMLELVIEEQAKGDSSRAL